MREHREIVFASWLAGIHRFYEKGAEHLVQECKQLLQQYMDIKVLLGILRKENAFVREKQVVNYAYELSLCESEAKKEKTDKRNLTSVFSRVVVSEKEKAKKMYYPLLEETVLDTFPSEMVVNRAREKEELHKLSLEFVKELKDLAKTPPSSWKNFIVVFDSLVRKYMWSITASDYEGEDISLYNQSRIAAAIASCVCRCNPELTELDKEKQWFQLAVCDFSGIQKYVFSVANVSESGVAKRLRARSFFVDITVSVIAQEILRRFHLTQNHILMLTGGKFYLLLPNIAESEHLLQTIQKEVEHDFYEIFKGQVAIHLAWLPIGADGLEYYSQSITKLMRILGEQKSKAFQYTLANENGWEESKFILFNDLKGKKICTSCGSELVDKEKTYCDNCRIQTEIGQKLPRTKYISYYIGEHPETYHIYGDYWVGLWENLKKDDAILMEQINGQDIPNHLKGYPIKMRYMANHIPLNGKGEVVTFSDIAQMARGTKKLAVLKADVDNLGYIFADGLRVGKRHFGTISRVNTMSRFLEIFFSGYINHLMTEREEFRSVYSVFSGGDDLFLIGPWDVMPKLAVFINKEFHRFTAQNLALTLSATVSVFGTKEHIANLAKISEATLKRVKNGTVKEVYPEKEGRNGVSFMGELYSWEDLEEQLTYGEKLVSLLEKNQIDTSVLRRIMTYSMMYQDFLVKKDIMALMFEPLFHYDRQRNYEKIEKKKFIDLDMAWFLDGYVKDLTKNAGDYRNVKKDLYFAKATVNYAMNITTEERNNGI